MSRVRAGRRGLLVLTALAVWTLPASAGAQEGSASVAEGVAAAFLRSVHATRWDEVARRVHPESLETFRSSVRGGVESRIGDAVLERLLGGVDRAGFDRLSDREVFERVMASLARETPGLIHALVVRPTRVLGVVAEDGDRAHVVYRVEPGIDGEQSVVRVMTLARAPDAPNGWAILRSDELEVMRTAIHGIPMGPVRSPSGVPRS